MAYKTFIICNKSQILALLSLYEQLINVRFMYLFINGQAFQARMQLIFAGKCRRKLDDLKMSGRTISMDQDYERVKRRVGKILFTIIFFFLHVRVWIQGSPIRDLTTHVM